METSTAISPPDPHPDDMQTCECYNCGDTEHISEMHLNEFHDQDLAMCSKCLFIWLGGEEDDPKFWEMYYKAYPEQKG